MNLRISYLTYILVLIVLLSCSVDQSQLRTAEQLMETKPDSALHLLQRVRFKQLITRSDKALYALLMSQALDKNDIHVESDSLISIATAYYDEKDAVRAGYAWFYTSRCANNSGNEDVQAKALIKAQEFADKTTNYKLRGLIYGEKGNVYGFQQQFDSSIFYTKRAYHSFMKLHDYQNSILCLINIGYKYLYTSNSDKGLPYLLMAERLAPHCNDIILRSSVFRTLGATYYQQKNYSQALDYYYKTPLTHQSYYDCNKWYLIATVYDKLNKSDSARYYLNKMDKLYELAPDYYRLWQTIYKKEGNMTKALYCAERVAVTTDSLYKRKLDVSFAGLEKKYKYQSLQVSNQALIIKNTQEGILLLITLFLLSLGASGFLFWRNRIKNHQLKVHKKLLEQEIDLVEKEMENINLLEQQVKMQNILLLNVEQYRNQSILRPLDARQKIKAIHNSTFHEELIACMDIKHNNISKRLIGQFPELTERDILISCLLLAEFETGMIATILDVKNDSIKIHRSRLRKKLGLHNSENLIDYLSQF